MSLPILTPVDFTGYYYIPTNEYTVTMFQELINQTERDYLIMLLNDKAYLEIKDNNPLYVKHSDLINGDIAYINNDDDTCYLKGLKEVLRGIIYYHYYADDWTSVINGKVQQANENSNRISSALNKQSAYNRYNTAVTTLRENIYPFIENYETIETNIISSIEVAGTYTITAVTAKYMIDGQIVTINNIDYIVSNVIDNTFNITTTTGLDFTDSDLGYNIFDDYNMIELPIEWL